MHLVSGHIEPLQGAQLTWAAAALSYLYNARHLMCGLLELNCTPNLSTNSRCPSHLFAHFTQLCLRSPRFYLRGLPASSPAARGLAPPTGHARAYVFRSGGLTRRSSDSQSGGGPRGERRPGQRIIKKRHNNNNSAEATLRPPHLTSFNFT